MPTLTDDILRGSATGDGTVTLDPRFQGLPDSAHGGTILALFDALSSASRPRVVAGTYRRRVPLATPLQLVVSRDATSFHLSDGRTVLVDGTVDDPGRPPPALLPRHRASR